MTPEILPPLIVILGPTAAGKTEISIQLAERLNGEILSADSRLLYKGMDIGTAKPTQKEQRRVPHHLIDVADPGQVWSLAMFQEKAHEVIASIHQRGRLPFMVGGTGQYVRAVTEDWQPPRVKPDPGLRKALEEWAGEIGVEGLHTRLSVLDPPAAAQIDARNVRRTIRALEVILHTGQRFSVQKQRGQPRYRALLLGLHRPRAELYERVDARIESMLANGLVEEVGSLLERGYSPALPTLSAIGYREIIAYLYGKISLEEAVLQIKRSTRVFVRRQANWFKLSDPKIRWFQAGPVTVDEMERAIVEWLHPPAQ